MKRVFSSLLFAVMLTLSGCNALQNSLTQAYNLKNCEYAYRSISKLSIAGLNLSEGLSPLMIPRILTILSGNMSSIPLNFTVNMDVKNLSSGAAAFQSFLYIISIDDVRFTTGNFNQPFHVEAGETKVLPIDIGVDIAEIMQNNSRSAIEKIVKNFIGLGDTPSKVTIQLKPSFKVGERIVTSPRFIPVDFTFGGK